MYVTNSRALLLLLSLLSAASLSLSGVARAENSSSAAKSADAGGLEEVVVTGTRRDVKFLDVPVSVNVFTEEQLSKAGINRPQDFLAATPNVTFIQTNHAGEAFVNIRGQTSVRQSESAVAVVVDGVQLATQNEFNGELFDIQQIEVLKGPQGALYGRNAAAGAIIITTKPPTDEMEGHATVSYGNWDSSKANASLGGPIVPGILRVRVSASYSNSDGPFQNIETGENSYRSNEKVGRVQFDWTPTDSLKVDLRFGASRLTGGATAANAQGPGIKLGGVLSPVNTNFADAPFVTDVPGLDLQDKVNSSLKMDYQLGDLKLTSITAFNRIVDNYQAHLFPYEAALDPRNDAGNAILFGDQTQKYRIQNKAMTQEIKIASSAKQRLRWEAGLYFLDSRRQFTTEQGYNGRVLTNPDGTPNIGIAGYAPDPNGPIHATLSPGLAAIFGTQFTRLLQGGGTILPTIGIDGLDTINPTNAYDITRYDAQNVAPFGNFQFDISSNWEFDAALRYDTEKRKVRTLTPDVINPFTGSTFNQCVALLGRTPDQCRDEKTFRQVQPKVSLAYKIPDRGSVFASYGRSFKSGGFNALGSRETVVRATTIGITRAEAEALVFLQDTYKKEVADAYELGFKSEWLDRRLAVNGAVFYTKVQNAQQFSFYPSGSIQAVSSIDKVENKGFELETNGRLTDELSLFASYGYVDSKIKAFAAQPTSVGNRVPYAADYNYSVGFQFARPVADRLTFSTRFEYNGTGSIWFDTANTPGTRRDPIQLANLRMALASERWEFALWSRNLGDKKYNAESVVLPTGIGVFNPLFKGFPRSYGVEGKVNF